MNHPVAPTAVDRARSYLASAIVTSALGIVLLLGTDFGGWSERIDYGSGDVHYPEYRVALGAEEAPGYANILIVVLAICLAISAWWAAAALRRRPSVQAIDRVGHASLVAAVMTGGTIAAGTLFVAGVSQEFDWWFDAGFYGGVIGGGLTSILLHRASRLLNEAAPPTQPAVSAWARPLSPGVPADRIADRRHPHGSPDN